MLGKVFSSLSRKEKSLLEKLNTPQKVQDYLDTLPMNFEETCRSPRGVIESKTTHCLEAAIFAAAALYYHNQRPLIMDLETDGNDDSHVVALFKKDNLWGAISKTNHAVLRYRDPVYRTLRELAMSYFNEYFPESGKRVLRTYSAPFSLAKYNRHHWLTDEKDLWYIETDLNNFIHYDLLPGKAIKNLRPADKMEHLAGSLVEWKKKKNKVK